MTVKELKGMLEKVDENLDVCVAFTDYDAYKDENYTRFLGIDESLKIDFENEVIELQCTRFD